MSASFLSPLKDAFDRDVNKPSDEFDVDQFRSRILSIVSSMKDQQSFNSGCDELVAICRMIEPVFQMSTQAQRFGIVALFKPVIDRLSDTPAEQCWRCCCSQLVSHSLPFFVCSILLLL